MAYPQQLCCRVSCMRWELQENIQHFLFSLLLLSCIAFALFRGIHILKQSIGGEDVGKISGGTEIAGLETFALSTAFRVHLDKFVLW